MPRFDGLILVDKPSGCSSHHVVSKVRRILNMKAVGHAGTLDPFASGLLVMLVGQGTKISDYILKGEKSYLATVQFGIETDTLDRTGEVLNEREVNLSDEKVRESLSAMTGELTLPVPVFSAVKVNGKRLYKYAREKQSVQPVMRDSVFSDVDLVEFDGVAEAKVSLRCSKGSFVRAWASEWGRQLGCGAHLKELRRTESSPYHLKQAVTLDELEQAVKNSSDNALEDVSESIADMAMEDAPQKWPGAIGLADTLPGWPTLRISGYDETLLLNGQVSKGMAAELARPEFREASHGVKIQSAEDGLLLAILVQNEQGRFKIRRVFPRS